MRNVIIHETKEEKTARMKLNNQLKKEGKKICRNCKKILLFEEFPFNSRINGVRHPECKECRRILENEAYAIEHSNRRRFIRRQATSQ